MPQITQSAYSGSAGTTPILIPVQEPRSPTTLDVNYPIYQRWINTSDDTNYFLEAFDSSSGTVLATWVLDLTATAIQTLTGDSGGAVSGDGSNNVNILGTSGQISVVGNPGTSTLTISLAGGGTAIDSVAVQTGTSPVVATAGGLITINGAVVAAGTNPIRTDGTGANTLAVEVQTSQAIVAADATKIGLCNFDSSSFEVAATGFVTAAGTGLLKTLTGNSGGAISPTANNINTVGTGSITVSGAGSTLTTQLTGLTNHSLLVGAGTATITNLGVATNGQLPIGSTGADPVLSTLTAGTGIAITNGAGSITISVDGGGLTWSDKSTNFNAAVNNGYFISGSCIATLPASPSNGDEIAFFVDGAFVLTITANTGQTIQLATNTSSSAGTQANTASGDACTLVYRSTDTKWCATSFVGAWNKT